MADTDCCWSTGTVILLSINIIVVILYLLRRHAKGPTYQGMGTMAGKTVIITGGNAGIGKETAKGLAMRGARVVMGCRNMQKAEEVCQEIMTLTNNKNIECRKLDLASFESIRAFAKNVLETESRIDVLINNAGIFMCPKAITKDGLELQIGVNHFGHFLLTNLLLDRIKESAPSRIVNVSSIGHIFGTINFDDLQSKKTYSRYFAYTQSKLANILHALELTKRLKGTGVTANSLHPGAVDTDIFYHITWGNSRLVHGLLYPLKSIFYKSPWQGAQTTLLVAVDPKLENVSGKYFNNVAEKMPAKQALSEADAKRLWEVSEAITSAKKDN